MGSIRNLAYRILACRGTAPTLVDSSTPSAADVELAPYLIGVDRARLAGHLALTLTVALGGPPGRGAAWA
ncbi:hypothetical protein ACNAW0_02875 [Micromonospora sp. SL1-18]|uniref:hypothetical protein n=1 Tax=Micromonospora sp. SL1-18 TaxID=3399128 RepID=UPI003A4D4270